MADRNGHSSTGRRAAGAARAALLLLCGLGLAAAAAAEQRVLVFGDSLTWGWEPNAAMAAERQAPEERWPAAFGQALGEGYAVLVDAAPGRTTYADEPELNGLELLAEALERHQALDLVIVMLGTNDTKEDLHRAPEEIAEGARALLQAVEAEEPGAEVLLLSPPPVAADIPHPAAARAFAGAREKGEALAGLYRAVAEAEGAGFFDAGRVVEASAADGIHLTAEANAVLGAAVAEAVRAILGDGERPEPLPQ